MSGWFCPIGCDRDVVGRDDCDSMEEAMREQEAHIGDAHGADVLAEFRRAFNRE